MSGDIGGGTGTGTEAAGGEADEDDEDEEATASYDRRHVTHGSPERSLRLHTGHR
jgi:hypothetical protein